MILLSGCGGSADSTSSARPAQGGRPVHAAPAEHPGRLASDSAAPKGQERTSSQSKHRSRQEPRRTTKSRSAASSSPKPSSNRTADPLAKVKELVGGSKVRTVGTPKQIHKVLQELSDQSDGDTAGSHESGGGNSPSGVDEVLEALGGG
jgi:hypothetical protein